MVKLITKNSLQWWHQNKCDQGRIIHHYILQKFLFFFFVCHRCCVRVCYFRLFILLCSLFFCSKTIYYSTQTYTCLLFVCHKHTHTHTLAYYTMTENLFFFIFFVSSVSTFSFLTCIGNFLLRFFLHHLYIQVISGRSIYEKDLHTHIFI